MTAVLVPGETEASSARSDWAIPAGSFSGSAVL